MKNKNIFGLREKIAASTSEADVVNFLKEGNQYEFANERTRKSWKNTAYRVLNKIKSQSDSITPDESVTNDIKKTTKKNSKRKN